MTVKELIQELESKGYDDEEVLIDGEDIEEVFDRTGVRLMLKEDFDRVKEVEEVEE